MKKFCLRIAIAVVGIAALGLTTKAQAIDHLVVTVPFPFVASGTTLPAGTYTVRRVSESEPSGGLLLTNRQDHAIAAVLPIDMEATRAFKPELTFETAGDLHVLTQVQTADHIFNIPVSKSSTAALLANNAKFSFGHPGSR
jgi:hypothetical protein